MLGSGGWQAFPHALSTSWFSHTHGLGVVFLTRRLGCSIILSTLSIVLTVHLTRRHGGFFLMHRLGFVHVLPLVYVENHFSFLHS